LEVGHHAWIGEDVWIDNLDQVTIGAHACVSQGAYFCTGNHDWSDPAFGLITRPIVVEPCAWIGAMAVLCPGVVVGEGGVITAGTVAARAVASREIHYGNPSTLLRQRTLREPATREASIADHSRKDPV
jgi:putative colanic acid biosynthesis acetyltransferase WcaF